MRGACNRHRDGAGDNSTAGPARRSYSVPLYYDTNHHLMSSQADVLSPKAVTQKKAPGSTNANGFTDYFDLDGLLTEEHILVRQSIRDFVKREISPNIERWAQDAHFPSEIVRKFGEVGAFGPTIPTEYGGGGMDYISYGLIMQEIERGDSGMRSTASVQGSLVMFPIYAYGSEEQRRKFLPKLASGEWLGCFGLTEPDHGSNPGGMTTTIKDMGDYYLLNGAKLWISNSPQSQVGVVWAKDDNGRIRGVIVEKGMEAHPVRPAHRRLPAHAAQARRNAHRNHQSPADGVAPRRPQKRGQSHERPNLDGQAQLGQYGPGSSPRSPPNPRRNGHHRRIPDYAPYDEPRIGDHLRGHARYPPADYGAGYYGDSGV